MIWKGNVSQLEIPVIPLVINFYKLEGKTGKIGAHTHASIKLFLFDLASGTSHREVNDFIVFWNLWGMSFSITTALYAKIEIYGIG